MRRDRIPTHLGRGSPQRDGNEGQELLVPSHSDLEVPGGAGFPPYLPSTSLPPLTQLPAGSTGSAESWHREREGEGMRWL